MEEFNIEVWLNKKPDTTNPQNINHEKSVQIREIRGDKNMIRANSCQFVDQEKSAQIPEIRRDSSVDLQEEIELLTKEIENRAIDIAPDYQSWRDIGFALTDALGESGREYFHRLSRFYPNYSAEETDKQFTACLNHHGHGITYKTIFHLAKQVGITITPTVPISPIKNNQKTSETSTEVIEVIEGNETMREEKMPSFYGKVKDHLPDFLKQITKNAISDEDADLLILGTITVVSACLPNISGIYAGREVFPNIFLFVTAQASAGKGRLSLCRYIVDYIHKELRKEYENEMETYKRQQADYALNKKDPDAEQPQEPPLKTLFIPANSSSTAVYQVLNDNKGIGLIFETEGDTLANTFKSDYGNFSDGFRKAFHHETISYNRRKDKEFVELEKPRLSALLSGTPKQILSLIPDAENGLFSRFIFYYMNVRLVWNDVFAIQDETLDRQFEDYGRQFFDLYRLLKISYPIRFALSPSQQKEFHAFFEQIQNEYSSVFGIDFVASVRRLGIITFRIAMIMSALRILEDGSFSNVMVCSDDDFFTVKTMVETLLKHTAKVYQMLPENISPNMQCSKNQLKQQYYNALPSNFYTQTAIYIAQSLDIPQKTAERYLKQWCLSGQMNRVKHGWYSKV